MSQREVTFWFGYNSPYSMLAYSRAPELLEPLGVRIVYRPFFPGLNLPDYSSPKVRYVVEDVERFVNAYGLRIAPGPYVDLSRACRGFLFARERGLERAYNDAVHRARWFERGNIDDPETLLRAGAACGLERDGLAAALDSPRYAERLAIETIAALDSGVFGVPFFVFAGRGFWGNDRLEWLVEAIRRHSASEVPRAT